MKLNWLAGLLVLAVVGGFFLPWFKFQPASETKRSSQKLVHRLNADSNRSWISRSFGITSEEQERMLDSSTEQTNGYQLPELMEQSHSSLRNIIIHSQLLGSQRVADRSYFAFAMPVLSFFFLAYIARCRKKLHFLLPLAVGVIFYFLIRHQLDATYFDRITLGLSVGIGLWLDLYALLGLCFLLLIRFFVPHR